MELSDLIRGGGSSGVTKFISGFRRRSGPVGDSLTITAPTGQKVVLISLSQVAGGVSNYTIIGDGVTLISNSRLQTLSGLGEQVGSFLIGISGASSYTQISTVVPLISAKSITITNVSGTVDYSYSYLFVEDK